MSVGTAIVLRARNGRNLLVQTQGMELKQATQLVQEALMLLEQNAVSAGDPGDIAPCIQGPTLTCGSLRVAHERWRVSYRAVGQVVAFVVAPTVSNGFSALNLLERVARVVTLEGKYPDVGMEKVIKRYPEIYLALNGLLSTGGALTSRQAVDNGRAALEGLLPGSQKKAVAPVPDKPKPAQTLVPYKNVRRTLANQSQQLPSFFNFNTADALHSLRPLPGFEPPATSHTPPPLHALHQFALMPGAGTVDPFAGFGAGGTPAPASQQQAAAAAAPSGMDLLDDLFGLGQPSGTPAKQPQTPAAAAAAVDPNDPFAFITSSLAPATAAAAPGSAPAAPAAPPPPPAAPTTPLLQLSEAWRAEVEGARVVRAGLDGRVTWAPELAVTHVPAVKFSLQPPQPPQPGAAADGVQQALRSAHGLGAVVRQDGDGQFVADVAASKQLMSPVILKYHLGPSSPQSPLPLQAAVAHSMNPLPDGQTALLLSVQVAVNPVLRAGCKALCVRVKVPSLFELPARVEPSGAEVDGGRRTLTWRAQDVGPGASRVFAAVFIVSAGTSAVGVTLRQVVAEVELTGQPGTTLTGVRLEQGFDASAHGSTTGWSAHITARPKAVDSTATPA